MMRWLLIVMLLGLMGCAGAVKTAGDVPRYDVVVIGSGLAGLTESFARFALKGLGTPAPIAPTKHLVVSGLYRYVRNPMYLAVATVIVGQALVLGQSVLLWYTAIFVLATAAFVYFYEQPTLRRQFGDEYRRYCESVPAWLPRVTPYRP